MPWWYADSQDAERWHTGGATKEDAIATARAETFTDGEPFTVAEADQQPWRFDCFDQLDYEFDGANEELGDGDGDPPSIDAGIATMRGGVRDEVRKHLEAALEAWVREHGKPTAWALNFSAYHDVPATAAWHEQEQAGGA